MKTVRTIIWVACILGVVALLLYPRLKPNTPPNSPNVKASAPAPIKVNGYIAQATVLANQIKVIGTVLANEEVELRSETSGRISKLYFKEGAIVSKGQLLLKMNDLDLQAQLKKVKSQNKLAVDNEKRLKSLLEKEGISQADYEIAINQLNISEAEIEGLNEQIRKTEIRAPFSGVIGLKDISEGAYISPQTKIATLHDLSQIKVEFSIPERYASQLGVGANISFTVENTEGKYNARIYAIEPKIDLNTRNLMLRAVCTQASGQLFAGSFAEVNINLSKNEQALLVPTEAVVPQIKGKAVYVAKNGKAILQTIKAGTRLDKQIQVLDGIQAGDTIITTGLLQIRANSPISLVKIDK